MKETRHLVPLE